jgi:hypothetical protein
VEKEKERISVSIIFSSGTLLCFLACGQLTLLWPLISGITALSTVLEYLESGGWLELAKRVMTLVLRRLPRERWRQAIRVRSVGEKGEGGTKSASSRIVSDKLHQSGSTPWSEVS